jgi:hypothetical protein
MRGRPPTGTVTLCSLYKLKVGKTVRWAKLMPSGKMVLFPSRFFLHKKRLEEEKACAFIATCSLVWIVYMYHIMDILKL